MGYRSHVRKLELQYWEKDGIVSDVIDEIVILLGDETDSSSSESDTSEYKSESDDGNDSDLAQPPHSEPSGHDVTQSVCSYFCTTIFYKLKICPFLLLRQRKSIPALPWERTQASAVRSWRQTACAL
jgi:hypothetical protein